MLNRLKGILYDIILWLATQGSRKSNSSGVLIVKTDEIGDFLLWRPFLTEIVNAPVFKDQPIHFCGNSSWKSLFITFHDHIVPETYWLDKTRFKKDLVYRYRFLKQVYKQEYQVVINPTYSRDKRNDDAIVKAAKSVQTIGMVANSEGVKPYELGYDRNLYTSLFDHPEKPIFEFYRNRLFTEFITGHVSGIQNTCIDTRLLPSLSFDLPEQYAVIFPGSRSAARIWPTAYFVEVSNYLYQQYGFTIVVAGAGNDEIYTTAFASQYAHPCINLYGKTSLPQMLSLLKRAQCLLSVDTGSVHLAAAVGTAVFGVFNGSQYKRFAPYPKEVAPSFFAVYPDEVEEELKNPELVKEKYEFVIPVPYQQVTPGKIIKAVEAYFNR